MSWLFSQALVEGFSGASSWDGERCAPLNVMPSPRLFWRNDKTMDVLKRSPFGLTWKPLTADRGAALLTWFRAGFPARTFRAPARGPGLTVRKADCGGSLPGLLARWDRDMCLWRTAQCSLFGGLDAFSGTWPRWGLMRNGECFRRLTPSGLSAFRAVIDRHLTICGSESGLWQRAPTPRATEAGPDFAKMDGRDSRPMGAGISLQTFVARAPTPRSEDSQCAGGHRGEPDTLTAFVRLPTPRHGKTTDETEEAWQKRHEDGKVATRPLTLAVKRLPTMTNSMATPADREQAKFSGSSGKRPSYQDCKRAPTACANDWKGSAKEGQRRGQLTDPAMGIIPAGGQLNPEWEDWFMGWPIGWTDVRRSGMDRFRQWFGLHGGC